MTSPNEQQRVDVLLPCPFCGSNKVSVSGQVDCSYVVCDDCGAEGPFGDMTGPQAISAWNARTGVAELIEAARPIVELAELFDDELRGGNMPKDDSDPIMQWPRVHKEYELNVGHLRNLRAALANVGAQK